MKNRINIGNTVSILKGDVRETIKSIPDNSVQCAITSPPYWGVRDYGFENQIGSERKLTDYIDTLVSVFSEVRRILKPEGTFWLNIANTYTSGGRKWRQEDIKNKGRAMNYRPPNPEGLKNKDLIGVAWQVALACQMAGWYLRNDIIWHKPNCQPESVRDRFTVAHEYLFLMTKSEKYYFDQKAVKIPSSNGNGEKKNRRTVWSINTKPYPEAHFAVFPIDLIVPCLLSGSRKGDTVFDPFFGSGTVGLAAQKLERKCIGIEVKDEYIELAKKRNTEAQFSLFTT